MPKGGRRPGAGRPHGAKDSGPRRQHVTPLPRPEVAALLDYAKEKTRDGSVVEVLESFRTSTDPEHRKYWLQFCASYGAGLPRKRAFRDGLSPDEYVAAARARATSLLEERQEVGPPP